jgi:DNA-binding beta-propeller fold protein YncE
VHFRAFPPDSQPGLDASAAASDADEATVRCGVCLELIAANAAICPECGESTSVPPASLAPSTEGEPSWLRMHWRPLATMTVIGGLIGFGVALRHLAPDAYQPARPSGAVAAPVAEPACDTPCWHGEACELGKCVFRASKDAGSLPEAPSIAGPFALPEDFVDVLPVDSSRYLVSFLGGVQVTSAKSGEVLTVVSDAPQAQRLFRVGDAVYASAPQRIYVIDAATAAVRKTIEVGKPVADLAIGAGGARVLVSMPAVRAVAVIATDYHAEVARFSFGDDQVGAVAVDDAGERAMTSNGDLPLPGLRPSSHATTFPAVYAFDPGRLPSQQDRVRTGMDGNPVDVMMAPDARTSFVVLREKNRVVPVEHTANEIVRQMPPIETCLQPEQIELIRAGRRAIVRCNAGHAVDIIDLARRAHLRRIELNARVSDMVVTPDGKQAILTLPRDGRGVIAIVDLGSYAVKLIELSSQQLSTEVHRVRLAPDGKSVVVISDRSKAAWVLR